MRDYSSISPSAKSLLLMKGLTDIPFIAQAVELVWGSGASNELAKRHIDATFLKRLIHFEARYKSIDQILESFGSINILEISSGFSFRGLDRTLNNPDITYIDTDLPGVIDDKNQIINDLIGSQSLDIKGDLLVMAMNALEPDSFIKTISYFPAGPITIVNEGLLVYFNLEEKARLCEIIRNALIEHGGCWITADIYIKREIAGLENDQFSQFLQAHNVEDNKFDSFEHAEQFFAAQGLKIYKKAEPVRNLSSFKYLPQEAMSELLQQAGKLGKIRETWALVPM